MYDYIPQKLFKTATLLFILLEFIKVISNKMCLYTEPTQQSYT